MSLCRYDAENPPVRIGPCGVEAQHEPEQEGFVT